MADEETAADAFAALGDPTRIEILRAFAEALRERDFDSPGIVPELSFSEIHKRVHVDSTSRLSYHLEQLDGTYLRSTAEGWKFTFAGDLVARLYLSAAYVGGVEFEPVAVDGVCPFCGARSLQAVVDELVVFRECVDCGERLGAMRVTPAQVENRDAGSLLASTDTRMITYFWRFREGVCMECGGTVDRQVRNVADETVPGEWIGVGECEQCWRGLNGPLPFWLASHPAVVAFHWEYGVDALSLGIDELLERRERGDWVTERIAPDEYEVTYHLEDAELRLSVDDTLSVDRTERVRTDSDLSG